MSTVNVSLPNKLKQEAESLVSEGEFVSFSDVIRTALRQFLTNRKHETWLNQAKQEELTHTIKTLNSLRQTTEYLDEINS
ncbi:MAG TPA: type II toxin-antitoxin system ParD family antitoxin [Vitreimonas sp.]|nr:type II toxin-antitoxin system ParD family antitoxin [Vitreimonas sp.]